MKLFFVCLVTITLGLLPAAIDLIAHSSPLTLAAVAILCYLAYRITRTPAVAQGAGEPHYKGAHETTTHKVMRTHYCNTHQKDQTTQSVFDWQALD